MEQLNNWNYCQASTKAHPLAKKFILHLQKIETILKNEGANQSKFKDEVALNLDNVEIEYAKKQKRANRKTVDLVFCIKKDQANSKAQTVLTELKLRVTNERNINKNELKQKVDNSIALLTREIQIQSPYFFIFKSTINERAKNRVKRLFANNPNYKVISTEDLHRFYFATT